ncbi:hypothetical protein H4R99_003344 [Coemansia sp. RSA 1722]|nr:hypothetical protein LPJ57_000620 [Coemansia sp. RSA 486]KAJ2234370.1 hypothetical protein IWW45_003462 [Coemansia sp. RSA 485]KAJ2600019.1 hypothetical protein GGF39_001974 [Coemansia sp. RSA 1721]KAJ2600422.1 hypothetical protein H4R99_003344 [Coemansia sp. RSA 1722]KAJ2637269.1 hypothetical protein GGF40_002479 [Coemansia sp. RSA 1286]KAJ2699755.1 hypothetical protein FB645_005219 [Coemansia sp. IMI 203386]
MSKPKILCLHGFAESADVFKIRSRRIRELVEDHAELVYLNGPIDIGSLRFATQDENLQPANDFTNLGWWWWKQTGKNTELRGIGKTMDLLATVLEEQGPFDGIMGFSQGASLAILLAQILHTKNEALQFPREVNHPPIKFLVLAGAFEVEPKEYHGIYENKLDTPSLHMMGEYDTVIDIERSRKMAAVFKSPVCFEFRGGHFIPQTTECVKVVQEFLAPFIPGIAP